MSGAAFGETWRWRLIAFAIGAILWALALAPPAVMIAHHASGEAGGFSILPAVILFFYCLKGWDWFSQYGDRTYGEFLKTIVVFVIALTGIGMVFVCYWTGRRLLRQFGVMN